MLGGFQLESPDHLQATTDSHSYGHAQKRLTDAVRDLQFCTATGLKPIRKIADKRRIEFCRIYLIRITGLTGSPIRKLVDPG